MGKETPVGGLSRPPLLLIGRIAYVTVDS